jgi:hypothetical protein
MEVNIYKSNYKDIEATVIESSMLKAVCLPEYGGKMASLLCKQTGREFLVQAYGEKYRTLDYAGRYIDAECSGFDDMFPTINEWEYTKYPWKGVIMPDHGEVCGLPWKSEIIKSCDCLHCWVYGVRFPYRLDKWIRLAGDSELEIEYELANLSPFDMDFIWAGHIMIAAESDAQIVLPYEEGAAGTCVFSADEHLVKPGNALRWPVHNKAGGKKVDIRTTLPFRSDGNTYKYYFDEPMPKGRCGYAYPDGTTLMLNITKETVPYLGIWVNGGTFKEYHSIALEPCTGTFDNPGCAIQNGQNSVLTGNGKYSWQLRIEIGQKI